MPVLVVADLHLDVWKRTGRDPLDALGPDEWAALEAVIVAGDLSNDPLKKWPRHLGRLAERVTPGRLHVIPGNHDYYGLRLGDDATLAALCADQGARLAQKSEVVVGTTRYLCATLWTDAAGLTGTETTDFHRIRAPQGGPLTPADMAALHGDHAAWLDAALARDWPGETVVVTHHAPHLALLDGHSPASAYASDLSAPILRHAPARWLYGHTHHPARLRIGATEVANISFGLPGEVPEGGERARLLRGMF